MGWKSRNITISSNILNTKGYMKKTLTDRILVITRSTWNRKAISLKL